MSQEQHNFRQQITCVKFPGIVKDTGTGKALQCIGGCLGLSQAVSHKAQRLELNFNPTNHYHRPVYGDREKVSAILLKVKKNSSSTPQVVGVISDCFTFKSMCDFQFLPPADPETSIFPTLTLPNPDELLERPAPTGVYLPAPSLSRMDTPSSYSYSNKSNVAGSRPSRKNHTQRVPFSMTSPFPSSPLPGAFHMVEMRKLNEQLAIVKEVFKRRPIWSRSSLEATVRLDRRTIGIVLPCVGFFFQGGPWRLTWCRHGYDPRIDRMAGQWQTIEFRAQSFELCKHLKQRPGDKDNVTFREGSIPPHTNCLYQMVDIELSEAQKLFATTPYKQCHEKQGWLVPGTLEKVRKLIDETANEAVIQRYGRTAPDAEEEAEESDDSLVVLEHQNVVQSGESDSASDF